MVAFERIDVGRNWWIEDSLEGSFGVEALRASSGVVAVVLEIRRRFVVAEMAMGGGICGSTSCGRRRREGNGSRGRDWFDGVV